ncbi:MAG TPA: DUF1569 domain-containing protein [Tepidisphaeraceae bacterium]|nr:DUF1569 domain-containing protein [Tepidisphaeraceae bacterium]
MPSLRRPLTFSSLSDIPPDIARLLPDHTTVGQWSLAQILSHLTFTLTSSLDGFPGLSLPRPLQLTLGRYALARLLRKNRIPERFPLPRRFQPAPHLDLPTESSRFSSTLARYLSHTTPLAPHPLFGPIPRPNYDRYHAIHIAHHLSFAIPMRLPK